MNQQLVERLRAETPGCLSLIHFNNAGCSLSPQPVIDAVQHHQALEQRIGGYEAAEAQAAAIEDFYPALAALLGCAAEEVAWVESATRGFDLALHGIAWQPGDRIVCAQSEYASNWLALLHLRRLRQVELVVVPNQADGTVDLEQLDAALTQGARLVCLTHVASQQGVVQPAAEVGRLAAQHGALYFLDACQSAGQVPLDVRTLGCHVLTGSGRKYLRGPRGSGFLYVQRDLLTQLEPLFVDLQSAHWDSPWSYQLRDDARRFETWECHVAGKVGLAVAARYAVDIGIDALHSRIATLAGQLRRTLAAVPGLTVLEPMDAASGIVTFRHARVTPDTLQLALRSAGINTGVTRRATAQLDFARRDLQAVNRASVHAYNTEAELQRLVAAVAESTGE